MWKKKIEHDRPTIVIMQAAIQELQPRQTYRMLIPFKNIGSRPGRDVTVEVYIIKDDLRSDPSVEDISSIANDIWPKQETAWSKDFEISLEDKSSYYVVVAIEYEDPMTKEKHQNLTMMVWPGVVGQRIDMGLSHIASSEEKQKLEDYLNQRNLLQGFFQRK